MKALLTAWAIGLLMMTPALAADEFKITFGAVAAGYDGSTVKRVKVQSLMDKPVTMTDVIMNEKPGCLVNGPTFPKKLELGDEAEFLTKCNPVRVRIITTQGEHVYGK